MYASYKNVLILIALLKKKGVRHVVLSPGGCDMPIVRSIESDPWFTCYSVVDERSATYFAVGLAQSLKMPVASVCTSGTAVLNCMAGMSEAFYQGVPLVLITADRHQYLYKQLETQKINQTEIFKDICKKTVSLPVVHDDNDFWYCQRLVNEALLELDHRGTGPVHINIPTGSVGLPLSLNVTELPDVKLMQRISANDGASAWQEKIKLLPSYKKILVVCGQNRPYSAEEIADMEQFFRKYNCILAVEHLSNLKCEGTVLTYPVTEMVLRGSFGPLLPDLVISLGHNFASVNVKAYLRQQKGSFEHWMIEETGEVKDVFQCLSVIFECSPSRFFKAAAEYAPADTSNDGEYYGLWQEILTGIQMPEFPLSNMHVAQELAKRIPEDSVLHLSILNSTRQMQYFSLPAGVEVFSNVGALGIDGSMSTFIGQAAAADRLCFLLIGDLSFFYDMNSVWIRHVGKNVRIIVVNNGGGGEFHHSHGEKAYPRINEHISVKHGASARAWVESLGFAYYKAESKAELDSALTKVVSASDRPVLLEVFTDMAEEGDIMREFYSKNRFELPGEKGRTLIKNVAKTVLGESGVSILRKIVKK